MSRLFGSRCTFWLGGMCAVKSVSDLVDCVCDLEEIDDFDVCFDEYM